VQPYGNGIRVAGSATIALRGAHSDCPRDPFV